MKSIVLLLFLSFISPACSQPQSKPKAQVISAATEESSTVPGSSAKALFAGGCFWCMEPPFDKLEGVIATTSGFAGGKEANPAYTNVASGKTGHVEAVLVQYDPSKVSYRKLVDTYWRQVDPTDGGGSFVDRGPHYRPVIFYYDTNQKKDIEASLEALKKLKVFKKSIVTEVTPYSTFYPAEDYHQDYYKKNPIRYKFYRYNSGRDQFLKKVWGDKK